MTETGKPGRVRTEETTLSLRCDLTDPEKLKKGAELARTMGKIASLEDDLTAAKSQYKSVIDRAKAEANELGEAVRNGYEFRDVVCDVYYDYDTATVSTWRRDTGDRADEREMTAQERQRAIEFDAPAET